MFDGAADLRALASRGDDIKSSTYCFPASATILAVHGVHVPQVARGGNP